MRDDHSTLAAAGVAFYGFLSMVPALAATVSMYGLIAAPADVDRHVSRVFAVLPGGARQVLADQLAHIADEPSGALGGSFVLAFTVALWSASRGVQHLLDAIGQAYDVRQRGVVRRRATALAFTLGTLFTAGVAVAAFAVLPGLVPSGAARWSLRLALWVALAALALVGIELTYRLGSDQEGHARKGVAVGSLFALVALVLVTLGTNVYVANSGSYNATYGVLAGVVILMLWVHLLVLIVLLGAYINADLGRERV
ncbi:MAG: YhjD/YihY/BrkB family envelope integrity protein [Actinomycetota bacterium]|nr:YhjD/YihY/BrkB family envelope integrity protein [Actinomycetota bacterium]